MYVQYLCIHIVNSLLIGIPIAVMMQWHMTYTSCLALVSEQVGPLYTAQAQPERMGFWVMGTT